MSPDEQGVRRPKFSAQDVLGMVSSVGAIAEVVAIDHTRKDSTNMRPSDWTSIAERVRSLRERDAFDAFVITHGTDTMAYSAGALSLAFGQGLAFPVVLTGSQMTLVEHGSDARFNLENAFRVAVAALERDKPVAEVMISFAHSVLRGSRARKRNEVHFDAFESPACDALASIDYKISFDAHVRTIDSTHKCAFVPGFTEGVFHVRLTPGIKPDFLRKVFDSRDLKGVILESFGAGNVPNDEEEQYTLIPIIKELVKKHEVPIVITTSFVGGRVRQELYEPGKAAADAGAIPAADLTTEMAAVKLMWLLAQRKTVDEIRDLMTKDLVGEVTPLTNHILGPTTATLT